MKEKEMTGLLIKMADLGITGIKVNYEGSGDSGSIEWIGFTNKKLDDYNIQDLENLIPNWEASHDLEKLDGDIYDAVYEFSNERLLDHIEDWWNNEGGYGDLFILVPSGEYYIKNNVRITETELYEHEGFLFERTDEE
jgi:hypothetical protein